MDVNSLLAKISSSKEILWPSSVVSGIFVCLIIYKVTGFISRLCFKAYENLNRQQQIEWNNRGFSTSHAVFMTLASLYLLLVTDQFKENSDDDLIINRTSTTSEAILMASIGYFLSDLAMILWNYPALGGWEYVLHHGLSMFSIYLSVISGQAQFYILMVILTESTTPCINLRWYLDTAGQKGSKMYIYNGVALFLIWLVARILLFIYLFTHMYINFDQVLKIFPLGFYSILVVPALLSVMNVVWFAKITKGMIKTLSKAKRSD